MPMNNMVYNITTKMISSLLEEADKRLTIASQYQDGGANYISNMTAAIIFQGLANAYIAARDKHDPL